MRRVSAFLSALLVSSTVFANGGGNCLSTGPCPYTGPIAFEDQEAFRVNATVISLVSQRQPLALKCRTENGTADLKPIEDMTCEYYLYAWDAGLRCTIKAKLNTKTKAATIASKNCIEDN